MLLPPTLSYRKLSLKYHPEKNKFIPVILSAYSHIAECAAFEVVFNDNIPIPYVEVQRIKDYISKIKS